MKAAVIPKPGIIYIEERDIPEIRNEDDILIKVKAAGICGSDLHIYHGKSPVATYPRVIGHEFVGEVVDKGKGVKKLNIGDRVAVEPILYCGECYPCRKGRHNVCEKLEVLGVHRDGGFQEYIVVSEKNAYPFGDQIPWEEAALIEPFTIAAQVRERGLVQERDNVFIIGAGPIGLCILQYLLLFNVRCGISDICENRLNLAREIGAHFTINAKLSDTEKEVFSYFPKGANVVIDAVGLPETFEQAIKLASSAGRVVLLGFDRNPSSIPQAPLTLKELTISGSRLQANKFPEIIKLFEKGKIKASKLISHIFPFEKIVDALNLIERERDRVCKVILIF